MSGAPRKLVLFQQLGTIGSSQGCLLISFPPGGPLCISIPQWSPTHGARGELTVCLCSWQLGVFSCSAGLIVLCFKPNTYRATSMLLQTFYLGGSRFFRRNGLFIRLSRIRSSLAWVISWWPFCHQVRSPVTSVCISGSGPSSVGGGRPVPFVDGLYAYAFPPFVLLPAVLHKVRMSQCRFLLVAPLWSQRPWFSDLLDLLFAPPRRLPSR